jgi:chemotaxis protein MotA
MFAIVGILVVFGAVVGGYLMEKGHIAVLLQPAELVIIAGAAVGTVLVANPTHILKQIAGGLTAVFGASKHTRLRYSELLQMMFQVFNQARRGGWAAVEGDIEEPAKSKIFSAYPAVLSDHHTLSFICDSLRTAAIGAVEPFDLDQMMELDMDAHHHAAGEPVAALSTMADSLPGLGIVAAVLGVVITMGALGGPPEEIGHKVAAALVGTFLGILLCYGLVGPLAARMGKAAEEERACHHVLRVSITSFVKGTPPIVAVEMARRAIPPHVRPGFKETENACRSKRADPAPVA